MNKLYDTNVTLTFQYRPFCVQQLPHLKPGPRTPKTWLLPMVSRKAIIWSHAEFQNQYTTTNGTPVHTPVYLQQVSHVCYICDIRPTVKTVHRQILNFDYDEKVPYTRRVCVCWREHLWTQELTRDWRKQHDQETNNLYRLIQNGYEQVCKDETGGACSTHGKRHDRYTVMWPESLRVPTTIKMDLKQCALGLSVQMCSCVNAVINLGLQGRADVDMF